MTAVKTNRSFQVYSVLVIGALLVGFVLFLRQAQISVSSPIERDYGEGIVLWQANHITNLAEAFHPLSRPPYIVFHYTPLYHYFARLMNLVIPDPLEAGRLVSVLFAIGIAVLTASIVFVSVEQRNLLRVLASVAAGLLTLHLPPTFWSLLMRVDTAGLFFSFCGIFLYVRSSRAPWLDYAAFVCFVAAVYCRQTLVAAPAACLLCTTVVSRRRALRLALFTVGLGAAIAAFFMAATHGQFFVHLFRYNINPFDFRAGLWLFREDIEHTAVLTTLAFTEAILVLNPLLSRFSPTTRREGFASRLQDGRSSRLGIVAALYAIFAFCIAATSCKVGAAINYFLEWNLACCILAGLFISDALAPWQRGERWFGGTAACIAALAVLAFNSTQSIQDPTRYRESEPYRSAYQEILKRIQATPGPIYSDIMTPLLRVGKEISAEPAIITALVNTGQWDESPLIERFRRKEFGAVVVSTSLDKTELYTAGIRDAIRANYVLSFQTGPFHFYTPRR